MLGKPDFVFGKARVAVFIDGDFWHGNPRKYRIPKSNRTYWHQKITTNRARDRLVTKSLESQGWKVLRIWESSLADGEAVAGKVSICVSCGQDSSANARRLNGRKKGKAASAGTRRPGLAKRGRSVASRRSKK